MVLGCRISVRGRQLRRQHIKDNGIVRVDANKKITKDLNDFASPVRLLVLGQGFFLTPVFFT
jgi:hypothetical protein